MTSTKLDWFNRILSLSIASAIFGTAFLPEGTWVANLGFAIRAIVWILLVLALIGAFAVEIPKSSLWWSIPLTLLWIVAFAFVGWKVEMVIYLIITVIALARRFAPDSNKDPI